MVDLNDKKSCEKYGVSSTEFKEDNEIKRCADCGTSKTPLWRSGPAGPKTLCNACGIKSRKKRRAMLGLKTEDNKKSSKKSINNSSSSSSSTSTSSNYSPSSRLSGTPLHQRLLAIGREVMMRGSTVDRHSRKKKLGEDEQAAVLLMALSYGSVYA